MSRDGAVPNAKPPKGGYYKQRAGCFRQSNNDRAFDVCQVSKKISQLFVNRTDLSDHSPINFDDRCKLSHGSSAENFIGHIEFRQRNIPFVVWNLVILTEPQNIQPRNPFRTRNGSGSVHNAVLDDEQVRRIDLGNKTA